MKNKKRHIILLCLILSYSLGFSQYQVSGYVKSADEKQDISYITVRLLQMDSTFVSGTVTDSTGLYRFDKVHPKKYLIAFSSIGYLSKVIPVTIQNTVVLPAVTLASDQVMLGEIVVKGSYFIRKEDHVLILPDKQQLKHANSGYDLLYNLMIPGIDVNRRTGEVTTFGGDVSLYINGEKANYRDVQSLRPRDILHVEYYDVPIGKYTGDISAINYITKPYSSGGYIALDGKQTIGYVSGDYNIGAKFNRKNTTYAAWGGYNMKKHNGMQTEKHEEIFFPSYTVNRDRQTENATFSSNQQYVQFKVNNQTKLRNLSAQVSLVRDETPKDGNNNILNYSGYYTHHVKSSERKVSKSLQPSIKLYGEFKLPKDQSLNFTLRSSYSQNDHKRTYIEDSQSSITDIDEDMYSLVFSGNYNFRLKKGINLGVGITHNHKISSSIYTGDYTSWQHLWSGESIMFITYTQKIGKSLMILIRPGFSYLNYKLHHEELKRHNSLRFNTMLLHQIDKTQQVRYYVNIGNITPDISFINNVQQTVDFLQIMRGNPNLDNTKLYNVGVNYVNQWGRLNFQGMVDYMGYIDNVNYHYYFDNDKLINSFRSGDNAHVLSASLGATYRFSKRLRAKLSTDYVFQKSSGKAHLADNSLSGKFDVNYFWKDFSLNIYGNIETSKINIWTFVHEKRTPRYGASVSWSRKNWYAEAGVDNPFNHSRSREYLDLDIFKYNQLQRSRLNQSSGYVKLSYTFDFGRKTSREKDEVDKSINSAIMKVN